MIKLKEKVLCLLAAGCARFGSLLFWIAFALLALISLWCLGAFFRAFDLPAFCAWAAAVMLAGSLVASWFFRPALAVTAAAELATVIAFLLITPESRFRDTVWQKPWRRTLKVKKLADGRYELANVRDCLYRSEKDYDLRYRTVTVSPEQISSIDAVFSHWDDLEGIAHSMLGLNFADGTTVVISLETRLPEGVEQNGLDGLYRRYELAMLAGTPEDLYGLRTDYRGETLYVYRLRQDHRALRDITLSLFSQAEELQAKPEFYNSLCRNCTTGLKPMLRSADQSEESDIRVMLNGFAAHMLFESRALACRENESFGSLRARSLVPGLCYGKGAPRARYGGESECRWLRR